MDDSPELLFGSTVRQLRQKAGLSIAQLAELAGLDVSYVNHVELGRRSPTLGTMLKLSKGLGLPLVSLLKAVGPNNDPIDRRIGLQVRALLRGRNSTQQADIVAILKQLRNPRRVLALRQILKG